MTGPREVNEDDDNENVSNVYLAVNTNNFAALITIVGKHTFITFYTVGMVFS